MGAEGVDSNRRAVCSLQSGGRYVMARNKTWAQASLQVWPQCGPPSASASVLWYKALRYCGRPPLLD
jgi:hypothetical protein